MEKGKRKKEKGKRKKEKGKRKKEKDFDTASIHPPTSQAQAHESRRVSCARGGRENGIQDPNQAKEHCAWKLSDLTESDATVT